MNILICFCILIISMTTIYFMKKILNKQGLELSLILMNTISLILSFKLIKLSNFTLISNSITYISIFTIIYLLLEITSIKETKKIINTTFITSIFLSIMLYIMSYYTQAINDTVGINMSNVFIKNSRLLLSYPITSFISSHLTVLMYNKIKNIYNNIFINTTTTYLAIGLIDIILYTLIGYLNLYEIKVLIEIALSTYMIRLIITVLYVAFITKITTKKVKK